MLPLTTLVRRCAANGVKFEYDNDRLSYTGGPPDLRAEVDRRRESLSAYFAAVQTLGKGAGPTPSDNRLALTPSMNQQYWWGLRSGSTSAAFYQRLPIVISTGAPLQEDAFRLTMEALGKQYTIIRSRFRSDGGELVGHHVGERDWQETIETCMSEATYVDAPSTREDVRSRIAQIEIGRDGPPFVIHLLNFVDETIVYISVSVLIFDERSVEIFRREFLEIYRNHGYKVRFNRAPLDYESYALWQRASYSGARLAALETFWTQWARDIAPIFHPRTGERITTAAGRGLEYRMDCRGEEYRRWRAFSRALGVAPSAGVMAAVMMSFAAWCKQDDARLIINGDMRTHRTLFESVGQFICYDAVHTPYIGMDDLDGAIKAVALDHMAAKQLRLPPLAKDWAGSYSNLIREIPIIARWSRVAAPDRADDAAGGPRPLDYVAGFELASRYPPMTIQIKESAKHQDVRVYFNAAALTERDIPVLVETMNGFLSGMRLRADSCSG